MAPQKNKSICNISTFINDISSFLHTPFHKLMFYALSYTLYILLFMFVLMTTNTEFAKTSPSSTEWTLWLYWIAIFVDEFKQLTSRSCTFRIQIKRYFRSYWNRFDFALLLYIFLAIFLPRLILFLTYGVIPIVLLIPKVL